MALPRARLTAAALLALGAASVLSGCSQDPNAAAIVNGQVITEQQAQTASAELETIPGLEGKVTPALALQSLIVGEFTVPAAARAGLGISDDQARQALKLADPSAPTIAFAKAQLAKQALDAKSDQDYVSAARAATITVNPRYGSFDLKTGAMTNPVPDWIKPVPVSNTPETSGGGLGQPAPPS